MPSRRACASKVVSPKSKRLRSGVERGSVRLEGPSGSLESASCACNLIGAAPLLLCYKDQSSEPPRVFGRLSSETPKYVLAASGANAPITWIISIDSTIIPLPYPPFSPLLSNNDLFGDSPKANPLSVLDDMCSSSRLSLAFFGVLLLLGLDVVSAFTVDSRLGDAEVSHSGPTLLGGEREKRAVYYQDFNQFPNLLVSSEPPNDYLKMWITNEHNRFRKLVPATDMRMLYWSDELAASAQRHANRCDFRHSRDRVNVGENIWAAPYANYSDAVERWFQEVNDPRCGCNHAYKHCCGHYVQVVWAQTNLVGCGYARCNDVWGVQGRGHRHVFVCHYNPQGNTVPAFTWATQNKPRCSDCPTDAPACYEGLCYMPSAKERLASGNAVDQRR
ncbi:hypothetical protein QR680_013012 [Steinernema hermaphroditum]|uniref:SCP domain-containing protein n=1 Tax=Steinernema hermaphroditum TaxID=289476 RepID=A0AA39I432_9BILA|nr:hypothetical protein QR680_013012 [Steinernema hermaphroditum]